MKNKIIEHNSLFVTGNAEEDGKQNSPKGWFIGNFIDPVYNLRCTNELEVKWGTHQKDEEKSTLSVDKQGMTLTLLVSGFFNVYFPDINHTIKLKRQGDYVIFASSVAHRWKAVEDSVVLTIRWPSIRNVE